MVHIVLSYVVFSVITQFDAARILAVVPTPSLSHQIVFRPITLELARRGHDLTIITSDPIFEKGQFSPNFTEINVHDISYKTWDEELNKIAVGTENDMIAQIKMFIHLFAAIFEQQLHHTEIENLIKNDDETSFDLILAEGCVRPALIFSHIFKAPVIQISSFGAVVGMNAIFGVPNHPLLQPAIVRQRIYNLTMWEKIRETYHQLAIEYIYFSHKDKEDAVLKNIFGPNIPSLSELHNNVQMVFLNEHPLWNDNEAVPPKVILMGGIPQNPSKKLPKDLESYLNSSKHGVIYLSFGTNVQSSILPPQKVKMMTKVFSELPYDVIWKWDSDLPEKPKNIRVFKWLPQSDLLRHPNVKLFITQGGLQSTDEAITGGVPMIGIPVIADQWYNTEKYVRHGIGMKLEMGTFTEEEFKNAILTVINDHSYRHNVQRLRHLMRDEPQTALERVIWWTEYVLRHGGARHLRCPAANMSFAEYYELKLILIVLSCILTIVIIFCLLLYRLQQYVSRTFLFTVKQKES